MSAVDDLVITLKRRARQAQQAQIRFAECVSVNWEAKTMTAKGTADEVEYLDVLLGLGNIYTKPSIGAVCLLGVVEGEEAASFLIAVEQAELVEESVGKITISTDAEQGTLTINGGQLGGLIEIEKLKANLDALKTYVEAMNTALPEAFTAIGAAMEANGATGAGSYSSAMLGQSVEFQDMEDKKVVH